MDRKPSRVEIRDIPRLQNWWVLLDPTEEIRSRHLGHTFYITSARISVLQTHNAVGFPSNSMDSVFRDMGTTRMLPEERSGAASTKAGARSHCLVQGSRERSVASGGQLRSEDSAALSGVGVAGRAAL